MNNSALTVLLWKECGDRRCGLRWSICTFVVVTARCCIVWRERDRVRMCGLIVSIGRAGNAVHVHWTALLK